MSEDAAEGRDGEPRDGDERAHLEGVDDGCGCAEIWEQLSERREDPAESE